MEVGLAQRHLELPQHAAALGVELEWALHDRLRVGLTVKTVELDQESHWFRPARVALDPGHRLERRRGRKPGGPRQRVIEQEALDHAVCRNSAAVPRLVGLERKARLQDRGPLEGILGGVRKLRGFLRDDVGHVRRAFDELAQANEIAGLVVEHRVLEQTVHQPDAHLHVHQKRVEVRLSDGLLHAPMQRIDLLVKLGRQGRADRLRCEAGRRDAGADRRSEGARHHHLDRLRAPPGIAAAPAGELHESDPEVGAWFIRPIERERHVHAEDARQVVGSLEVASEQGERRRGAAKHRDPGTRRRPSPRCRGCRRPASC